MIEQPHKSMPKGDVSYADAAAGRMKARRSKLQRRTQAATAALGALALASGVTAALDAIIAADSGSSHIGVGRLAITLAARDGFKLDSCTSATSDLTDSSTTNSTQSDATATNTQDVDVADTPAATAQIGNGGTELPTVLEYRPTINLPADHYDYDDSSDDEGGSVNPTEISNVPADNFHPLPDPERPENSNWIHNSGEQNMEARFNELPVYRPLNNLALDPNSYVYIPERAGYVHIEDLTQLMRDAQNEAIVNHSADNDDLNRDMIINGFRVDPVFADYLRIMQQEDPIELLTQFSNQTLPIPENHEFIYWPEGGDEGPQPGP